MKTWLWWSSGKDSAWALHTLRAQGQDVSALVTTINAEADRVAMHAVRTELVRAQAQALDLPLHLVELPYPCPNGAYEEAAGELIRRAEKEGVTHMAFGDLFLQDIRDYRVNLLEPFSIEPIFPLWQLETRQLAESMIDAGLVAHLTCVDPKVIDKSFAGRLFDRSLLDELPASVDPCGENGEFHSFVAHGPGFRQPIQVKSGIIIERDGFVFADVLPA